MGELVLVDGPADGIATLTLNRPEKKNALSIALRDELSDALAALAADERVKAVVVTGAGDAFCAGFDLKEFQRVSEPGFGDRLWASSDRYHRACLEFPLPMIAAVNGAALAGGFDLAVMCDIRIAAETARFGHPEITFGDVVYGPAVRSRRRRGRARPLLHRPHHRRAGGARDAARLEGRRRATSCSPRR